MNNPTAIITADLHLREDRPVGRIDDYWAAQEKKIKWLSDLQKEYGCPIFDAGDVFNKHRVSPYLEQWCIRNLPDQMITVPGNHDLPNHNIDMFERSSLGVLAASRKIQVLKSRLIKADEQKQINIFGVPYGQEVSENFKGKWHGLSILILHMMCYQGKPPYPGADKEGGAAKSLLKKYPDFNLIITGHNHQSFVEEYKGRVLVNPGSMMRLTTDQKDFKPRVYLWYAEENRVEAKYFPIQKNVIDDKHITEINERDERIESFVSSLKKGRVELGLSFEENLKQYIVKNKIDKETEKIIWEVVG